MLSFEVMNLIWSNDYMNIAWHNKNFELDFIPDDEDLDLNMDKLKIPKLNKNDEKENQNKENPEENAQVDDKRTQLTDENATPEEKA